MHQVLRKALLLSLAAAVAVGAVTALASAGPGNRPVRASQQEAEPCKSEPYSTPRVTGS